MRQYKGGQPESGEHGNALVEKVLILTPTHPEARHRHCVALPLIRPYDHPRGAQTREGGACDSSLRSLIESQPCWLILLLLFGPGPSHGRLSALERETEEHPNRRKQAEPVCDVTVNKKSCSWSVGWYLLLLQKTALRIFSRFS